MVYDHFGHAESKTDRVQSQLGALNPNVVTWQQGLRRFAAGTAYFLGLVLALLLAGVFEQATHPYPQVLHAVAVFTTAVALFLAARSRETWADFLAAASTLLMLLSVWAIGALWKLVGLAADLPKDAGPGSLRWDLLEWLPMSAITFGVLLIVALLSFTWAHRGRRWLTGIAVIWSGVMMMVLGWLAFSLILVS